MSRNLPFQRSSRSFFAAPGRRRAPAEGSGASAGALLTLAIVLLMFVAADLIRGRLAANPRYRLERVRVVSATGDPVPEDRLTAGVEPFLSAPPSLLDRTFDSWLRSEFERRPWVRAVHRPVKRFPGGVVVPVVLRQPLASVRCRGGAFWVDEEGVLLRPAGVAENLPAIDLVFSGAPPVEGMEGEPAPPAVLEAVSVLKTLKEESGHPALESIRVRRVLVGEAGKPRSPGDSDISLLLDLRVAVRWGRAVQAPLAGIEPHPVRKLDGLLGVMRRFPGLLGIAAVDLRFREPEIELAAQGR